MKDDKYYDQFADLSDEEFFKKVLEELVKSIREDLKDRGFVEQPPEYKN
jgi:hypothetical protein